jgi:hypothetical protein
MSELSWRKSCRSTHVSSSTDLYPCPRHNIVPSNSVLGLAVVRRFCRLVISQSLPILSLRSTWETRPHLGHTHPWFWGEGGGAGDGSLQLLPRHGPDNRILVHCRHAWLTRSTGTKADESSRLTSREPVWNLAPLALVMICYIASYHILGGTWRNPAPQNTLDICQFTMDRNVISDHLIEQKSSCSTAVLAAPVRCCSRRSITILGLADAERLGWLRGLISNNISRQLRCQDLSCAIHLSSLLVIHHDGLHPPCRVRCCHTRRCHRQCRHLLI